MKIHLKFTEISVIEQDVVRAVDLFIDVITEIWDMRFDEIGNLPKLINKPIRTCCTYGTE